MQRRVFPIVNCADLLATRRFYAEVFGAEQVYQFPPDGEPVYVALQVGDGEVALGVGTGPALYGVVPLPASGHAVDICLYVADLDAVVAAAARTGAPVPVPPVEMPWGERVAYVRDPEGTMLLVIQAENEPARASAGDELSQLQADDELAQLQADEGVPIHPEEPDAGPIRRGP